METAPLYLLLYFHEIRKHAFEKGYLLSRIEGTDATRAVDETSMLASLEELKFITRSKDCGKATFDVEVLDVIPDGGGVRPDPKHKSITVEVPETFFVLSRGRLYWTEILSRCALWLLTAFLGAVVALLISQ